MPITQDRMIALTTACRELYTGWVQTNAEIHDAIAAVSLGKLTAEQALDSLRGMAMLNVPDVRLIEVFVTEESHFRQMSRHNAKAKAYADERRRMQGVPLRVRPDAAAQERDRLASLRDAESALATTPAPAPYTPPKKLRPVTEETIAELNAKLDAEEAAARAALAAAAPVRIETWRDELTGEIIEDTADRLISARPEDLFGSPKADKKPAE